MLSYIDVNEFDIKFLSNQRITCVSFCLIAILEKYMNEWITYCTLCCSSFFSINYIENTNPTAEESIQELNNMN